MKNTLIIFTIILLSVCFTSTVLIANCENKYRIIVDNLNIRSTPSITHNNIIGKYKKNDIVCVFEQDNNWLKTDQGWISNKYVQNIFADNEHSIKNIIYGKGTIKEKLVYKVILNGNKVGQYIDSKEILNTGYIRKINIFEMKVPNQLKMEQKTVEIYNNDEETIPKWIVANLSAKFLNINMEVLKQSYNSLPDDLKNFAINVSNNVVNLNNGYFQSDYQKELINGKILKNKHKTLIPKNYLNDFPSSYLPKQNQKITFNSYDALEDDISHSEFKFVKKSTYMGRKIWFGEISINNFKGVFKVEYSKNGLGNMLYYEMPYDENTNMELILLGI